MIIVWEAARSAVHAGRPPSERAVNGMKLVNGTVGRPQWCSSSFQWQESGWRWRWTEVQRPAKKTKHTAQTGLQWKRVEENQWRLGWIIWNRGPKKDLGLCIHQHCVRPPDPAPFCQNTEDCVLRCDVSMHSHFKVVGSVLSWWKSWVYEVSLREDCNQKVLQVSCRGSSSVPVGRQRLWCLAEVSSPPSGTGQNLHN